MTLISPYGEDIEFACDGCGFVLEAHTTEFAVARKMMRKILWKTESRRAPDERVVWSHFCSLCRPKPSRSRRGKP